MTLLAPNKKAVEALKARQKSNLRAFAKHNWEGWLRDLERRLRESEQSV
jgi:hypothetical protein